MAVVLMAWGCSMAETNVFRPKPLEGMVEVAASEQSEALDAEATAFLRGRYAIESARYYHLEGEVPWIALSKSVQNQMAERSIERTLFEWYEPGLDFTEVYPQGPDAAFAIAMPGASAPDAEKLVAFYVLRAPSAE